MVTKGPDAWRVVVNEEGQYAIYPERLDIPAGWRDTEFIATETECVAYVDAKWTDMRPRSLREAMQSA